MPIINAMGTHRALCAAAVNDERIKATFCGDDDPLIDPKTEQRMLDARGGFVRAHRFHLLADGEDHTHDVVVFEDPIADHVHVKHHGQSNTIPHHEGGPRRDHAGMREYFETVMQQVIAARGG